MGRDGFLRKRLQQKYEQLALGRKIVGFAGVHVFERGTPVFLAFAAFEADQISVIVFVHIHSLRTERYAIATWKVFWMG